jgi:hypothetical protein
MKPISSKKRKSEKFKPSSKRKNHKPSKSISKLLHNFSKKLNNLKIRELRLKNKEIRRLEPLKDRENN